MPTRAYARGLGVLLAGLLGSGIVHAQAAKRCDLTVNSTPGSGADSTCLDLVSLSNGGPAIQTAGNVTRISRSGLKLCKNAFQVKTAAEADIVFIFDNSGSMFAQAVYVDPVTNDTSFYYNTNGCADRTNKGTFTLQTANGPLVCVMLNSNAGCTSNSGDPYEVRGQVIRTAIDYIAQASPTSTAGVTGFAATTMHSLAPLQLNAPANVQRVKDSALIDSVGSTNYGPPLRLAYTWLRDPAVTKTAKHAIVFISDGAPSDNYLNIVDPAIPIFSIFLSKVTTRDTANLKQLSDNTQGTFNRVDPKNIAGINQVMQSIVQSLLLTTLPRSIEITNTSMVPPQISRSTTLGRNADSSVSLALDSIIGLKLGSNDLQIKIALNDTANRTYNIKVQADGPVAATSTPTLTCYDPAALTLLNAQGGQDSVYAPGASTYQVRLTRSSNDLGKVTIAAVTKDSTHAQPWGDAETIVLNLGNGNVYQGPQAVNGSAEAPVAGNGTLEGDANGKLILTWMHPRDPREFAVFELPGKRIPVVPPFIDVERVRDVTHGEVIDAPVADPVVIYGGANLVRTNPDAPQVTHGACLANCGGQSIRLGDPAKIPSFVFKTASPFTYSVKVFDNLGNFVNSAEGAVDAAKWQTMPRKGDSVAVVMSLVPVAKNGAMIGSGVYIMRATINSQASGSKDQAGNQTLIPASSRMFLNRFGYVRSR